MVSLPTEVPRWGNWLYRSCFTELHHKAIIQTQPHRSPYRMTPQIHLIKLTFQPHLWESPCSTSYRKVTTSTVATGFSLEGRSLLNSATTQKNAMKGKSWDSRMSIKDLPVIGKSRDSRIPRKTNLETRAAVPKDCPQPCLTRECQWKVNLETRRVRLDREAREYYGRFTLRLGQHWRKTLKGIPILKIHHP